MIPRSFRSDCHPLPDGPLPTWVDTWFRERQAYLRDHTMRVARNLGRTNVESAVLACGLIGFDRQEVEEAIGALVADGLLRRDGAMCWLTAHVKECEQEEVSHS